MDGRIKFMTLNTAGLNNPIKRIAKLIRRGKVNVTCLQETHIKRSDEY